MLRELSIRNFAIIDELTVEFSEGLTVLTGETGAGKSIIIDAVHILAGGRGSVEFIRHGTKKAELTGMFDLPKGEHPIYEKLEEAGIEVEEETIILRRDLQDSGKSTCRVNNKLVPLATLREIGGNLIDIHGQHENQELMDEKHHIHLLDQFAKEAISGVKSKYDERYEAYRQLKAEVASLSLDEKLIAQKIDLYQFQIQELEQAQLNIDEEDALLDERRRLMNFNKIFERANLAYESIQAEGSGIDAIGNAMNALEDITSIDEAFKEPADAVTTSFYALQDAAYQIKNIIDELEFDPERLNEVESRLALYQAMKRKYGSTVDEILTYQAKITEELDLLINRDESIQQNEQKLLAMEKELMRIAEKLTEIRKENAVILSEAIMDQLKVLHMEKAQFVVNFEEQQSFDQNGKDQIVFYISTNVGEPPKSLPKIASGGELSRMMLALKTIFSTSNGITSIIFDEVDTGVSGRVAQAIAEKIAAISVASQVLCISHLPQVAAMADHHYFIKKQVDNERTYTTISEISHEERVEEISRMMSGAEITETTLMHANELIAMANDRKKLMN